MNNYIDRDALIEHYKDSGLYCGYEGSEWLAYCNVIDSVMDYVQDMPTIKGNSLKHGHWICCSDSGAISIPKDDCMMRTVWHHTPGITLTKCSVCDWQVEAYWYSAFCPACGAMMDEEED